MRRTEIGVAHDGSTRLIKIKLRLFFKQFHAGVVVACNGTDITPVAFKAVAELSFSFCQQLRDNILAKVMRRLGIGVILSQCALKHILSEDVNAHRCQSGVGVLGLFGKLNDPILFINGHDTESGSFFDRNFHYRNGKIRIILKVGFEHIRIIHTVKLVTRKNKDIVGIVHVYVVEILEYCVGSALVPLAA